MGAVTSIFKKATPPARNTQDREEELEPCCEPFPEGLGPLSVRYTSFKAADVEVLDVDKISGGYARFSRRLFNRSKALEALACQLDATRSWTGRNTDILELRTSPAHAVNLPENTCQMLGIPMERDVQCAWVYPASFDRSHNSAKTSDDLVTLVVDDVAVQDLDADDADVSFLTIGGYMYFNFSKDKTEVELLAACAIRFSPRGPLQFSRPQAWSKAWTRRLIEQGRFRPITARRWVAAGALYACWVRPDELLPDERGKDRPLAHHGGFAFLFHELEEDDSAGLDRYFEVVATRALERDNSGLSRTRSERSTRSLPFNITLMPLGQEARLKERLFAIARAGRWKLVRHLLAEYPALASANEADGGNTLLHIYAESKNGSAWDFGDTELEMVTLLKEKGVAYDATNAAGLKAEDLGSKAFKTLVHNVWGIGPDLFEDPAGWFSFMDRDRVGSLEATELADGLASAYRCDEVGARWLKSFVNVNCTSRLSQVDFCGSGGFFDRLQECEDFVDRQQRTPSLFSGKQRRLSQDDNNKLMALAQQLDQLKLKHGWQPGKTAPASALPLPLPAPSPEGSADAQARLCSARAMLGFTFEQTRGLPAKKWQTGFRCDFAGQEGLDDGGLTKAWVNEIAYALWADDALFDVQASGSMFKPDTVEEVLLDGVKVQTIDLYRWVGRFVAYALWQRCLMDCRLCPWVFRSLSRSAAPREFHRSRSAVADANPWSESPDGEDKMLHDLASLDHVNASCLWRVSHEMTEDELRWLDFTCMGLAMVEGGSDIQVTFENKDAYVIMFCETMLLRRCVVGQQAFTSGFLEVLPARYLNGVPEDAALRLLLGRENVSDQQLLEMQHLVFSGGLVPSRLADRPQVRQAAEWVFHIALAGDGAFRTRLLEFWIGTGRVPLGGFAAISPRPKLQVMVQEDKRGQLKRIGSWPHDRLPEGHTCGNELWIALPDTYEELSHKLRLAVENFEAGFAMR